MSYSQFTIETVETTFGITIRESVGIFADIPAIEYSDFLAQALKKYIPLALAIATEKSRSELILTPILVELKEQFQNQISLFSGREFNVSPEKGLSGFCDFLISKSPEQIIIKAPVVALVEAKNDNIQSGLGQCIAEMVAAQLFNQQKGNVIESVYGSVTTGTNWKFMRLTGQVVEIDLNEYFLSDVGKILGIIKSFIESNN
ncbi:hypothetical protein H6G74_18670 [Nostoc spongiaeforme FACHB-130]|uniref:Uncharacterized protein n=1 Tax=Nostoc spongiaeforme FACHB-130 TaxID=1357510 RepID=A0ABR8FZS8_9NOSO|nr:hypothetical protein [Nostoc spongiaeforme]MBD2596337.1 hypothetical protein [Nostoc spongiaeforme FACHB-130]